MMKGRTYRQTEKNIERTVLGLHFTLGDCGFQRKKKNPNSKSAKCKKNV